MGDTSYGWDDLRAEERQRASARKTANLATFRASTLPFSIDVTGAVAQVRGPGYPPVDFFLSENRWRVGTRNLIGSAEVMIDWLKLRAMK